MTVKEMIEYQLEVLKSPIETLVIRVGDSMIDRVNCDLDEVNEYLKFMESKVIKADMDESSYTLELQIEEKEG